MSALGCHIAASRSKADPLPHDGQIYHPAHAERTDADVKFEAYHRGFAAGVQWACIVGFVVLVVGAALTGAFGRWLP